MRTAKCWRPTANAAVSSGSAHRVVSTSATNPRTMRTMSEHIDVDVTGILTRDLTMDQAGDKLIDMVIKTANGRITAAEALGHVEFVMTKLYRSA